MLAEVEVLSHHGLAILAKDHVALGIASLTPYDTAGKVHIIVSLREIVQSLNIVLKDATFWIFAQLSLMLLSVVVELALQHSPSSLSIFVGTVSREVLLHLATTIELISSSQVATLHLTENGAGVDAAALAEVEVDACPEELLGQQRNVEVIGVEAGKVTPFEQIVESGGQLLEGGSVFHVLIRDACQLRNDGHDMTLRIDQIVATLLHA